MNIEVKHPQISKPAKSLVSRAGIFANGFLDFSFFWTFGFLDFSSPTLEAPDSCVWEPPAVRISHQKRPPPNFQADLWHDRMEGTLD